MDIIEFMLSVMVRIRCWRCSMTILFCDIMVPAIPTL
ncbi:Uncharacterised protein [Mycobacteroides abscessus subsp. abscessus]|nr:Uncharacterised protein [Mycobacteroides abscessus subsp. abscessus]SKS60960.1 Uncharacterised protein [Mycobacteroides abscessus subsp. abscessus]SKT26531.1 Uncharacterised protein [Mycobacteroides abscessus subsp. abscessus]